MLIFFFTFYDKSNIIKFVGRLITTEPARGAIFENKIGLNGK